MNNYVGVIHDVCSIEELNRAAFLFDEILCHSIAEELKDLPGTEFISVELVSDELPLPLSASEQIQIKRFREEEFRASVEHLRHILDSYYRMINRSGAGPVRDELGRAALAAIASDTHDTLSRVQAEVTRHTRPDDTVIPLLRSPDLKVSTVESRRASVVRVALEVLPLPSASTPWQAILDWRHDAEAREQYRRLRLWIAKVARGDVPVNDIQEELAAGLDAYQHYMAIQHKMISRSRFEAIVVPVAEALEQLVRFRPSEAVKKLCAFLRDDVTLLERELGAPGREFAYIAAAHNRFPSE